MKNKLIHNYKKVISSIPKSVTLVAVSKTKPKKDIELLYSEGQRIFGENRVEELVDKYDNLPKDIKWHMIGHLQSKKVKKIAPFISLIHSVDSFKLLKEIDKQAKKNDRIINCLLQFHIAEEESKYGLSLKMGLNMIKSTEFQSLNSINIEGVMGMATFTDDIEQIRAEFKKLKKISNTIQQNLINTKEISMGMSGDYHTAIEEGSTIIRIGSTLFGARN